jgi:hypothetical protein
VGYLQYSATEGTSLHFAAVECVSEQGKAHCSDIGGTCITERDGYYITSALCVGLGIIALVTYVLPTARKLQGTSLLTSHLLIESHISFVLSAAGLKVAYLFMILHGDTIDRFLRHLLKT